MSFCNYLLIILRNSGRNIFMFLVDQNNKGTLRIVPVISQFISSSVLAQVLMMLFTIVVARSLGPNDFGRFSGVYSLTTLTSFFLSWGMDTWLLSYRGNSVNPKYWSGKILVVKFVLGIIWGLLLVGVTSLINPNPFPLSLLVVSIVDVWFDSTFLTQISTLNLLGRFRTIAKLLIFSRLARLVCAWLLVIGGAVSVINFAFFRCLTSILVSIITYKLINHEIKIDFPSNSMKILRESTPFGVSEFLSLIYMQADIVLLTVLLGSSATGLYSPASTLINALFIVPASASNFIIPRLSNQNHDSSVGLMDRIKLTNLLFLSLGVILSGGIFFIGGFVLRIALGNQYQISALLLTILSPLLFFKCLSFGWVSILIAAGWQKSRVVVQILGAITNVAANVIFIRLFGIVGVALAYVASEMVLSIGYGLIMRKWLGQGDKV